MPSKPPSFPQQPLTMLACERFVFTVETPLPLTMMLLFESVDPLDLHLLRTAPGYESTVRAALIVRSPTSLFRKVPTPVEEGGSRDLYYNVKLVGIGTCGQQVESLY